MKKEKTEKKKRGGRKVLNPSTLGEGGTSGSSGELQVDLEKRFTTLSYARIHTFPTPHKK